MNFHGCKPYDDGASTIASAATTSTRNGFPRSAVSIFSNP